MGTARRRSNGRASATFDLVVEGTAERVVDAAELQRVAETYAVQGWPASVAGDALTAEFSAPAAGPPPWNVYRVVPRRCSLSAPQSPTALPDSISNPRRPRAADAGPTAIGTSDR
jgi:hypothetical protein